MPAAQGVPLQPPHPRSEEVRSGAGARRPPATDQDTSRIRAARVALFRVPSNPGPPGSERLYGDMKGTRPGHLPDPSRPTTSGRVCEADGCSTQLSVYN